MFLGMVGIVVIAGAVYFAYQYYSQGLPDYRQLASYDPPLVTRIHAGDGRLLAEYAEEKRVFVPIAAIPKPVRDAFISAEDKTFYSHFGIDLPGIASAAIRNAINKVISPGRRPIGASTITQQVAKNILLTNEATLERKIREIILSIRIEQAFSKDRILELYLNHIYLGLGSYGIAAAALDYFDKSLDEITIAEAAYLAALPKAPNNYHPTKRPEAAKVRRDWVIDQMLSNGFITATEAEKAKTEPIQIANHRSALDTVSADYFAEDVRRELVQRFGDEAVYRGGLSVRTSLEPQLQAIADRALRKGLMTYDQKQGFRGPVVTIKLDADWQMQLASVPPPVGMLANWQLAVVRALNPQQAEIGFADGSQGFIAEKSLEWARRVKPDGAAGPAIKRPSDALQPGDVIMVEAVGDDAAARSFELRQIPEVSGGLVALDPNTGRVLAMSGGWTYALSEFNRASQAFRQPGSAFKPFVYLAALESGYTPSTIILDAPVIIDQGPGLPPWQPENYTREFYGPSTMRLGIEKSRNLMTVRMAQAVGMERIVDITRRFGIEDNMKPMLAMSLGAGETTVLRLTAAYAMLANGGKKITPSLIDRVQNRQGATIFQADRRPCPGCQDIAWANQAPPPLPDERELLVDPGSAYQMVSMLEGVIERGTGTVIKSVGKPLAGKTGTTNDYRDAWFVGFSPDLAVGLYMGYDQPRSMGSNAAGGSVAAPVFRDFMLEALERIPATPFRVPRGIRLMKVDAKTGLPVNASDPNGIWEAFKPGTGPVVDGTYIEGTPGTPLPITTPGQSGNGANSGGLY